MGDQLTSAQAADYLGLNIHAFRRIAQDDNISRTGGPGGWRYTRADLDAYLEAVRIRPGDISYLAGPATTGLYRPGSSQVPHR